MVHEASYNFIEQLAHGYLKTLLFMAPTRTTLPTGQLGL